MEKAPISFTALSQPDQSSNTNNTISRRIKDDLDDLIHDVRKLVKKLQ